MTTLFDEFLIVPPLTSSTVKKYTGTGVMIAYMLPSDIAKKLAIEGGEAENELHVTLLYLGKSENIEDGKLDTLKRKLESFCKRYAPLQGTIGGQGRFPATESSDNKDVLISLVDVPRLEALREEIIKLVKDVGIEPVLNHGYTPHVTIAYVATDYEDKREKLAPIDFAIDGLTCSIGTDKTKYPMNGAYVFKGVGPTTSSVHAEVPLGDDEDKKKDKLHFSGTVTKVDADKQLVFGWVTLTEVNGEQVVDKQGDIISENEMESMAYNYVLTCRTAGEMHEKVGVGKLVESVVFSKQKQQALGIDLGKTGWWCGFKINDSEVWKKVKDGTYSAFSIHGKGYREKVKA